MGAYQDERRFDRVILLAAKAVPGRIQGYDRYAM